MIPSNRNLVTQGFTLVEAIAVICLISIFASGSALILSGSLSQARNKASVRGVMNLHQMARRESREKAVSVDFDLDRQAIALRTNGSVVQTLELPESVRISKLAVNGAMLEARGQSVKYRSGGCETYAILVGSVNGRKKWYVLCGATGNVEVIDDEESTEAKLAQWLAQWANTN